MNFAEAYFPTQYPISSVGFQPQQFYPYSQQQQLSQQQQIYPPYYQQPNYYNYFYDRNELSYPADKYQSSSNDGGYTVYNLRKNAQVSPTIPGFHVYEPARKSNVMGQSAVIKPNETYAEEILKKNPHLWKLYQSGRFEIVQMFDSRDRKIILKEKSYVSDPKYTVTKYKIPMSANNNISHGSDDGHILLVSFSNEHIDPSQQIQVDSNHYVYEDVINKNYAHAVTSC